MKLLWKGGNETTTEVGAIARAESLDVQLISAPLAGMNQKEARSRE
jgi:hypothetical protein